MYYKSLLYAISLLIVQLCFGQNSSIYRGEADRIHNLVHTKLKVNFDFEKEQMPGEAWITLKPHFYTTDSLTLDAKGMLIDQVAMVNNNKNTPLKYTYDDLKLHIYLGQKFNKDQEYTIYIKYTARPNEVKQEGSAAITDAKGLYFINPRGEIAGKPTQIWTQGETESSSCWFPTIDKPNQKTTEEIFITVPDKFVTLSNGTLIKQTKNNDGSRTDYWKQDQKHAPYLFFMGIGDFAVIKDQYKNKPVDYYVEHEYAPYAKEIFGLTPEMIGFFSEKFGYEYPWDKYSQMICRDYVSGAMENTTAVIHAEHANQKHGQLVDENIWEDVISHELAHHWFGDLVTTESWSNLTLNESFANYSEYLWREYKYGKDAADEHRWEDLQDYQNDPGEFQKHLVRFHYDSKEDMFDRVSYNKGGYVLHMLRSYLGDDAFFAGLKDYLHTNAFGKAEAHQLRLSLEKISGKDLNWFFNQWYYGGGNPKLQVLTENGSKQVTVHIKQTQTPLFEFPITIDVYENGKAKRQQVWVEAKTLNTFQFPVSNQAEVVIANADNDLLCEINQEYTTAQQALIYKYSKDEYTNRMLSLQYLASQQLVDELALTTLISALNDPYEGIREQVLNSLDFSDAKVQKAALSQVEALAKNDKSNLVKAAAIHNLADIKNSQYLNLFEDALKSESYSVQSAGLMGMVELDMKKAVLAAQDLDNEVLSSSPELLADLIPIWKANNSTKHMTALTEMAAFHSFMAYNNPDLAKPAADAFQWIMSTDSPEATNQILNFQKQVYKQLKDEQPAALPIIRVMVQKALLFKSEALKQNPSPSLETQVAEIQKVLNDFNS